MHAITTFSTTESLEVIREKIVTWFRARFIPQTVYINDPDKGVFVFGLYRRLTDENLAGIERDLGYRFEECDYYDEDRGYLWFYVLK